MVEKILKQQASNLSGAGEFDDSNITIVQVGERGRDYNRQESN